MVQDTLVKRFPMTFSGLASLAESIYSDLDLLMKAAGVLAFLAGSYALYFKLLRPCVLLLRNCLYADRLTPWWDVFKALSDCFRHIQKGNGLYEAVRLRVELQVLKPRPERPRDYLPLRNGETKESRLQEFEKELEDWKKDINDRLSNLSRASDNSQIIEIENCFDFYKAKTAICNYLNFLANSPSALHKEKKGRFHCHVSVREGYLIPLHLLTGLVAHFDENWKPILADFHSKTRNPALSSLHQFLFDCWLIWGPSIPLCTCSRWNGKGIAWQYGYGDENNSIPVYLKAQDQDSMLEMVKKQYREVKNRDVPRGPAFGLRVGITGVPVLGEFLPKNALGQAQASLRKPDQLVLEYSEYDESVASEKDGNPKIRSSGREEESTGYYSAYAWVMLEIVASKRWDKGMPESTWLRLVPIFEHANVFDFATYEFLKGQLIRKVVGFLRHERDGDPGFRCRFACAFDLTGCQTPPMVEPPSPLIVELLVEAVKAAKLSDSLLLEKDEWSDADIFSTCHLPDLIMEMERSMTPTPDTQREGEILGTV
jgi:hypothetical protein